MEITKGIGKMSALTLAHYILKNYGPMSHLKLQKLLFYCQAYHLGYFGLPVIDEEFQAWVHGPVCRAVYDAQKDTSILYSDIKYDETEGDDPDPVFAASLNSLQADLITDVLEDLSSWTGLQLESATHREQPWMAARLGYGEADRCENIISKVLMQEFYAKEMNACC